MIVEAIFEIAAAQPARTALIFNDRAISYGEFAGGIQLAQNVLAAQGIGGPGVAILAMSGTLDGWFWGLALRRLGLTTMVARSPDEVAAARFAGLRCVIASPDDPWEGLETACAGAGVRLVITPGDLGGATKRRFRPAAIRQGGHILQTSGTTGAHKKVLIDPVFEDAFMAHRRAVFAITGDSLVSLFDFGLWTGVGYKSAVSAWLVGGAVLINQGRESALALAPPNITHATVIPQLLSHLLSAPGAIRRNPGMQLSVAGGSISEAQAQAARERITPRLCSSFGSTEASIFAFTALETPDDRRWHSLVPGRGAQVVDDQDRPVPPGAVGRLRVSVADGPQGYLDDPAATAAFFRGGYFYTGDLAVTRGDGRMALHGRVTEVINVMGHKLAPAPYEDALREALGVSAVCLFSMQDESANERLHLAIEAPAPLDLSTLTTVLQAQLKGFGGAHVHYLPTLPRNRMGKVQRLAVQTMIIGGS